MKDVRQSRAGRALLGCGCLFLAAAPVAVRADDIAADLRIDRVTVYRQGAVVTRTGQVTVPAGSHRLRIRGLPAAVEAKSLHVGIEGAAVRLGGLDVTTINEENYVGEPERELRRRIEQVTDQRQAVQDEAATAQLQLKLLESLAAAPAGGPTRAGVDGANLAGVLATMAASSDGARRRVREATARGRELDRTLERLKADLAKVATRNKRSTEVAAAVEAAAATTTTVSVSYLVPDAGWTWVYEARLDTTARRVTLERQASVEEGSGEDWRGIALTLTTAEPQGDAATPAVGSLFLDLATPEPPLPRRVAQAKAMAAPAAPLEEVVVTGATKSARVLSTEYLAEYAVPGRVSVLSDREPRLFPVGEDAFDVALVARVVPSAGRVAHLEATFQYQRDVPVEAGELQLYRDGAFVGEAQTRALLPGAEVRLPFGVDEKVRVAVHDEK
ncbi:MAG: mucoidy inhibitor MuiA family protein, partial [Proteobacteria bacterium]|nr:mucoidy inhibitor MuiA family protein [Pseudomonadota bacterium]